MNQSVNSITIVVPTYREVENIPHLVQRLDDLRQRNGWNLKLLLMDDDSRDGSRELIASLGLPWVEIVTRHGVRSLSQAVLDGMQRATSDLIVVMDADLSHPPEALVAMTVALTGSVDVVVGSRFTDGGSTAADWGILRWLNSRLATLLAWPLVSLSDPMSGYFIMRRSTFAAGRDFNPVGYKILLEVIIKCNCRHIVDVPIHFDNRRFGHSKLSFTEQLNYVRHLRRLYVYRYGNWSHLAQFVVVGLCGLVVNVMALTVCLRAGISEKVGVPVAIAISMVFNFALNRRFSFSYARDRPIVKQFLGYVAATSVGATVNYATTVSLWGMFHYKQTAALAGVLLGTGFNYAANRFIIFRMKHVRPGPQ